MSDQIQPVRRTIRRTGMTATKTPKGTQPNPPHTFEVTARTAKTEVAHCADCGKTKHRRIRKDR